MINPPFLEESIQKVRLVWNPTILEEDEWRARHCWFGPKSPNSAETTLLIGARSGLEAAAIRLANPRTRLIIVESAHSIQEKIRDIVGEGVELYNNLPEALNDLKSEKLDYVRMDRPSSGYATLVALTQLGSVRHLCGEVSPCEMDLLKLYRLCRHSFDSFFLRNGSEGTILTNPTCASPYEVSVVVPAYKVESYIEKCLDTLVNQVMKDIEIIVVDDGSPDRTGEIADVWAIRWPERIKVIHKENGGCASARMAGIEAATGEYIGFVDGDDWVELNMFEELYRSAVIHNAEISQCGFYAAYEDGSRIDHPTAWGADKESGRVGLVRNPKDLLNLQPSIWRRIYKRDFIKVNQIVFPEHIKRFDDLPFAFLATARATSIAVIPDCLYAYRLGRPGQDVEARDERLFVHFDIFEWLFEKTSETLDVLTIKRLLDVELATHRWALGRIMPSLESQYRAKMIASMQTRLAQLPACCVDKRIRKWKTRSRRYYRV